MENNTTQSNPAAPEMTKFCKHCGGKIPAAAVICTHCGCQVEEMRHNDQPNIVINNANTNTNTNTNVNPAMFGVRVKNKWVAFFLCLFFGVLGIHKFYEGRVLLGILYICTGGLCGVGVVIDLIVLFFKPRRYHP